MKRILEFISAHRTKLSGLLLVAVGSLQTNASVLQGIMSAEHFAYFTVIAGLVVAIIGSINTAQQRKLK